MAYEDDRVASETVRQAAKAVATTQAQHIAADLAHFTNLVIAGRKWGVSNHAAQAVLNLGGTIPAGPQKGDF